MQSETTTSPVGLSDRDTTTINNKTYALIHIPEDHFWQMIYNAVIENDLDPFGDLPLESFIVPPSMAGISQHQAKLDDVSVITSWIYEELDNKKEDEPKAISIIRSELNNLEVDYANVTGIYFTGVDGLMVIEISEEETC